MLRLVDVFSGCGGMTSGFMSARLDGAGPLFEPVLAVEHDGDAAETYALNFGAHVDSRSIEDIPSDGFETADVLIGGPPCQGFSSLNRNRGDDKRRKLWREYDRALQATGARYFVMENVPQLLASVEYEEFFRAATRRGWSIRADIVNAADFGVPQVRRRALVIGSQEGMAPYPMTTDAVTDGWKTVRDAIGHLPLDPDGLLWHRARNPTEVSRIRYAHVPHDGGNRFQMQEALEAQGRGDLVPPCWRRKTVGTTDVFGRMRWDAPAPTIRTEFYKPEKGRYLHPVADRAITIREGALLMGFDVDGGGFFFPEHQALTSVGRQIGNAVPPPLAEQIALCIARDAIGSVFEADYSFTVAA